MHVYLETLQAFMTIREKKTQKTITKHFFLMMFFNPAFVEAFFVVS